MNISPDGVTVRFKTEPKELFDAEKSGAKPNTVRIIDAYEADQIKRKPPTKIIIQYGQEIFLRTLTNIYAVGEMLGEVIVIFSWANEIVRDPHAHALTLEGTRGPLPPHQHTMSQDSNSEDLSTAPILLPRALITDLMRSRGKHTLLAFISELLANYEVHLENRERDGFVLVTVSEELFNLLQKIDHGRSINMVIHELYQIYLDKHAEERGALHD